jgi:hypothetical protein
MHDEHDRVWGYAQLSLFSTHIIFQSFTRVHIHERSEETTQINISYYLVQHWYLHLERRSLAVFVISHTNPLRCNPYRQASQTMATQAWLTLGYCHWDRL